MAPRGAIPTPVLKHAPPPLPSKNGLVGRYYHHQATGLEFALYRAYDPALGRWLSQDPLEENGGMNLYEYVQNNTVNLLDRSGKNPAAVGVGIAIGGGAVTALDVIGGMGILVGAYLWCQDSHTDNAEADVEAPDPADVEGKSEDEVKELMEGKGSKGEPTRLGGGTRYPIPGKKGEQVRVQPGNKNDPNPVKRGPYCRISKGGKISNPIPLKGNPTLP